MTSLRFSGGGVIVLLLLLSCLARLTQEWIPPSHDHGGVLMGAPDDGCDDAEVNDFTMTSPRRRRDVTTHGLE